MKNIFLTVTLLSGILFSYLPLFGRGFVEAQMHYDKKQGSENHFVATWNEEEVTATIEMKLILNNYRKDWHLGGFDLTNSKEVLIGFPEPNEFCQLAQVQGQLDETLVVVSNIKIILKGKSCKDDIELYHYFGVALTFYNVPSKDNSILTPVVRVQINDAP